MGSITTINAKREAEEKACSHFFQIGEFEKLDLDKCVAARPAPTEEGRAQRYAFYFPDPIGEVISQPYRKGDLGELAYYVLKSLRFDGKPNALPIVDRVKSLRLSVFDTTDDGASTQGIRVTDVDGNVRRGLQEYDYTSRYDPGRDFFVGSFSGSSHTVNAGVTYTWIFEENFRIGKVEAVYNTNFGRFSMAYLLEAGATMDRFAKIARNDKTGSPSSVQTLYG